MVCKVICHVTNSHVIPPKPQTQYLRYGGEFSSKIDRSLTFLAFRKNLPPASNSLVSWQRLHPFPASNHLMNNADSSSSVLGSSFSFTFFTYNPATKDKKLLVTPRYGGKVEDFVEFTYRNVFDYYL